MVLRGSLSFNERKMESVIPTKDDSLPAKTFTDVMPEPNLLVPESPLPKLLTNRNLAALKLQKTYKSFRTRRQLADCAILVEHRWWKLLDFAVLKCSSVSFFEIEKPETAVSRWSRARTRAAKLHTSYRVTGGNFDPITSDGRSGYALSLMDQTRKKNADKEKGQNGRTGLLSRNSPKVCFFMPKTSQSSYSSNFRLGKDRHNMQRRVNLPYSIGSRH